MVNTSVLLRSKNEASRLSVSDDSRFTSLSTEDYVQDGWTVDELFVGEVIIFEGCPPVNVLVACFHNDVQSLISLSCIVGGEDDDSLSMVLDSLGLYSAGGILMDDDVPDIVRQFEQRLAQ